MRYDYEKIISLITILVLIASFSFKENSLVSVDDPIVYKNNLEKNSSSKVYRIYIPNPDGTFITLEGAEAQAYYDKGIAETRERLDKQLESGEAVSSFEIKPNGHLIIFIVMVSLSALMMDRNKIKKGNVSEI